MNRELPEATTVARVLDDTSWLTVTVAEQSLADIVQMSHDTSRATPLTLETRRQITMALRGIVSAQAAQRDSFCGPAERQQYRAAHELITNDILNLGGSVHSL